jgi:alpha-glucosidase
VLADLRSAGADEPSFLVALNLGSREQRLALPRSGRVALSTHLDRGGERARGTLELRPDEGLIVRLANGD